MKDKFLAGFAIFALIAFGVLCVSAKAQTTQEGPGPSEQPSAPMEVGQQQPSPPPPQAGPPPNMQGNGNQSGPPPGMNGPEQAGPPPNAQEQGETEQQAQQEENQHGVAHISMMHGNVSTQRGDSGTWSAAVLNQPVVQGDKVSTGDGARAEVQLDYANILRLGPNAQANIANFTNKYIQIQLGQGLANYTVFGESQAEPEIDTPNVALHPAHSDGVFRIEVRPDGDTIIIVRKGEAQLSTPKGIADIKRGDMATVRGTAENAQYKIDPASPADDWDQWNAERDHMIHTANSWQHTNRYYTGSEDLDKYGRWQNVPDYGDVWVPNEPDNWSPYRDGNWVWEPYYGWTWVGYEPWGWAPYHYGRWFWWGGSWAWWPGPVWGWYRPFWAPAYVSFFGWGAGWGFGFGWGGWGGFGWLPIGPCDWFHPWWGGWGGRFGVVGVGRFGGRFGGFAPLHAGTRFSNIGHFNDPHISRGLSTMGATHFGTAGAHAMAATHEQLSGARMMTGNLPVVPTHASLSATGRAAAPSTIHTGSEHFFGTQSTPHSQSFGEQSAHLQQSLQSNHFAPIGAGGRTLAGSTEARGGASAAASRTGASASGREASSFGNRETGQSERSAASTNAMNHSEGTPATRSEPNRSQWKSFTPPSHNAESASRSESGVGSVNRGTSGSYWNRTSPGYSRSGSTAYGRAGGSASSRPQLDMRQPIARPRSYGGYNGAYGGYRGGYNASPSYSGGTHGGYSGGGGHASGGGAGGHAGGGGHR